MTPQHLIVPVYLFLCLLLGGASAAGFMSNLLLQLIALPIILFSLLVHRRTPLSRPARALLLLSAGIVAVLLVQLIPMPPAIWSALPGRQAVAAGYQLLGLPLPWLPLTLAPERALATVLWILPAAAVLLGIIRWGAFRASWIAVVIVAVALVSIFVGAGQVADADSPLYFYRVTNYGVAVGFFANANHLATLMVVAIPFGVALLLGRPSSRRETSDRRSGRMVMLVAVLGVLAVGLLINWSLAGIGLAVPVAGASLLLVRWKKRKISLKWVVPGIAGLTLASVAVILLAPIGNNLTGDEARSSAVSRQTSISTTLSAAVDYLPFGSGLGSFQEVYRSYEDPAAVERIFMNHAHSDLSEVLLELGIPGAILVVLFLIWWAARTMALWKAGGDVYGRAASIASGAILAHSLVDYPLRTAAIAAVFAACCALMVEPRQRGAPLSAGRDADRPRHLSA